MSSGFPSSDHNPYLTHQQPAPSRPPRRRGLAAAVLATSLIAGGSAGVGTAALWHAVEQDSTATATAPRTTAAPVADQSTAPSTSGTIEDVAAAVLPSVVKIDVTGAQGSGSGSGIILTSDGTILTNNHVVDLAASGGSLSVSFADGTRAEAEILGTDPLTDTAVIKAQGVDGLDAATIGKSTNLNVGQAVVAIGSPFGLDATVTSGIVSALNRPVNVGSDDAGNATTYPAIQTDAAINPGNSGGPLVDMSGAVVGINSSIRTASSQSPYGGTGEAGSIGLGFAIPIDEVMPIVDQMAAGEQPTHAQFGIRIADTEDSSGAEIAQVNPGSTAEKAGLKVGDIITKVNENAITSADSLVATIRSYRPEDTVTVSWTRRGEEHSADATLDSDATSTD